MQPAPQSRIPSVDGFRAISIVMVVLGHASHTQGFPDTPSLAWLIDATLGVRVFFVISGFLITSLLLTEEQRRGRVSLRGFYQRRFLRILPVYFSYLAVVVLFDRWRGLGLPAATFVEQATFTTGLFGTPPWVVAHTWSLAVEEQFYLFWPLTFVLAGQRRAWLAIGLIALLPALRVALYVTGHAGLLALSFLGNGDAIMWGCLLAIAMERYPAIVARVLNQSSGMMRITALALIYLFVTLLRRSMLAPITVPFAVTAQSLAVSYLLASYTTRPHGVGFRLLNLRVVIFVGVLSYSIYLWQQVILYPPWDYRPLAWQTFPLNLLLVLPVACVSYYVVERPFLRLKTRLAVNPPTPAGN